LRVPKIFLETSVFNFVYAEDAPDKREDTIRLFEEIRKNFFLPYTSAYVSDELQNASAEIREKLFRLIPDYKVIVLNKSDEIEHLADIYVREGIIPNKYRTDAIHIATATVNDLDIVLSWNFQHIVKRKTVVMTEAVNLRNGYKKVEIHTPTEVILNV